MKTHRLVWYSLLVVVVLWISPGWAQQPKFGGTLRIALPGDPAPDPQAERCAAYPRTWVAGPSPDLSTAPQLRADCTTPADVSSYGPPVYVNVSHPPYACSTPREVPNPAITLQTHSCLDLNQAATAHTNIRPYPVTLSCSIIMGCEFFCSA